MVSYYVKCSIHIKYFSINLSQISKKKLARNHELQYICTAKLNGVCGFFSLSFQGRIWSPTIYRGQDSHSENLTEELLKEPLRETTLQWLHISSSHKQNVFQTFNCSVPDFLQHKLITLVLMLHIKVLTGSLFGRIVCSLLCDPQVLG